MLARTGPRGNGTFIAAYIGGCLTEIGPYYDPFNESVIANDRKHAISHSKMSSFSPEITNSDSWRGGLRAEAGEAIMPMTSG